MNPKPDYAALLGQAEKAVSSIKDPELRRIAFQKILDNLLSSEESPSASGSKTSARKSKRRKVSQSTATRRVAGTSAYIAELIDEDFFAKPKTLAHVKAELENRGHHIPMTALSGPLQRACQQKRLRRQKVKTSGKKQTYAYSNW
jgi:hypothetical protein